MEPQPKKMRFLQQYYESENHGTGSKLSDSDESEDDERPSFSADGRKDVGSKSLFTVGSSSLIGQGVGLSHYPDNTTAQAVSSSGPAGEDFVITNKRKADGVYSHLAGKLMAKMGYKEGTGLGKNAQGRVDIVEASLQKGRRGLGVTMKGFELSDVDWDFEKEEVPIREDLDWIPSCNKAVPSLEDMDGWIKLGKKKMKIDDEFDFCSPKMVTDVCACKSVFDNLEDEEMRKARTRSNPYETIRGVFFLNRAAMKMANMDAAFDFMFTSPKDDSGRNLVGPKELLYFADICAGPGGFSEYVLWRKKWDAKGFGFTLKGPCDFKLEDFFAAPSELFEPHYGVGVLEGDGDIYRPDNLQVFQKFVLENTENQGVHFVMADGGFSVEGQENLQEILSKRLYLCQFLCALMILRTGGHFVCKLFDIFTPFSVGLIYLMYRAFNHVCIFKPVTSRPANSERYIVCKGKREDSSPVTDYMFGVNLHLDKISSVTCDDDITEVVPIDILKSDEQFFNYIVESNERLGNKQCIGLKKIQTFARNANLREHRQSDIREQCLAAWKIPDQVRVAPNRTEPPHKRFQALTQLDNQEYLHEAVKLEPFSLPNRMKSIYDYRCFVASLEQHWIILSLGKRYVFKWDGNLSSRWRKVDDIQLELPQDTVLEVEFIQELRGEGKGQRRVTGIHVIDGMFLCGTDIRKLHFNERLEKLRKFVKALQRSTRSDLAPVRVKDIYRCENIKDIFERLSMRIVKGSGNRPQLCYCTHSSPNQQNRYFKPHGICFVRTVKDPWMMAFSKSSQRKYFFNTLNKSSNFETPPDSVADFVSCQQNRLLWAWEEGVSIFPEQKAYDERKLSRSGIEDYIKSKR